MNDSGLAQLLRAPHISKHRKNKWSSCLWFSTWFTNNWHAEHVSTTVLLCWAGVSYTWSDVRKTQGSVFIAGIRKNSSFQISSVGWLIPNFNLVFLNTSSSFLQPFCRVISCLIPCNDFWTSVCPHFGLHLQPNKRFAFCYSSLPRLLHLGSLFFNP